MRKKEEREQEEGDHQEIILKSGTQVVADEGQFFTRPESEKSIELWQSDPLRLVKRFGYSSVLWQMLE